MLCPRCQDEAPDGSRFCCNCGAQFADQAPPPAGGFAAPPKRLMRSSSDKKIGGVCAGLADYFDLDPTIVRIIWLLAVFFAGTGFLVYIVLWIALPLAPSSPVMIVPGAAAQV